MKKLINRPDAVVDEALEGLVAAHPGELRLAAPRVVVRAVAPVAGKVGLVSGGGSGHEPLHAGFVGPGMLDAACPGEVFTSPVPDQILAATRAVDGGAGVLHIVKNYTGDVMNFELAAELASAEGLEVRSVLVADDVAVENSTWTAGRRGVGGTLFVEKIAGAAAEAGLALEAVHALATRVADGSRSMGLALTGCTVPAVGRPGFELAEGEMELGIGIHGEPGRQRVPLATADEAARMLLEPVLDELPAEPGAPLLVFVNGMGATPLIELHVVYRAVVAIIREHGFAIGRSLVGSYVTSLDMAGCSVSVLALDEELVRWWDAPVRTPALRWGA
jgi:phosphoenolpyruvate---glycerone phosphotransferase subunit DhaK